MTASYLLHGQCLKCGEPGFPLYCEGGCKQIKEVSLLRSGILGFILGVVVTLGLSSFTAQAQTLTLDPAKTSAVYGPIEGRNVKPLIAALSKVTEGEYTILIDSPGGLVSAGIRVMQTMRLVQARGVTIRCIVTGAAMSMADYILTECDTRYALPTAQILWHPIRIFAMGVLTGPDAVKLANQLNRYEAPLVLRAQQRRPMSLKVYRQHWKNESAHFPEQVNALSPGWITIIESVVGLPVAKLQAVTTEAELLDRLRKGNRAVPVLIYSPLFAPIGK